MFRFCSRLTVAALGGTLLACLPVSAQLPTFTSATVHDPSVVVAGGDWYVFGSHLAAARTSDGQHWTQLSTAPGPGNPLFPDPAGQFAASRAWVGGDNAFWAPDVIQLADGRFYYYYCIGRLDQPRAVLGIAVSDTITGPYVNQGEILRSGMWGQASPDGTIYDATKHPNAVDPDVFFDHAGRLWMVYGSYSGGIFILELDPAHGRPRPGQGYGRKLIGGHHARIEGAFVLHSPESEYYYMFLSYGGLAADGGYQIRLGRSRQPDGPYFDAAGNDLTNVAGTPGVLFDDAAIAPYGVKLLGNYQFLPEPGEPARVTQGYLSPGHNSALYDPQTGQHFLVFHTRFVGRGEAHEVRVHPLHVTADGWLVAAPHRYAGEQPQLYRKSMLAGDYKMISHGRSISPAVATSSRITLRPNGAVVGAATGSWAFTGERNLTLTLNGTTYRGVVTTQWDDDHGAWVYAWSVLSADGRAVWGSRVVQGPSAPAHVAEPDRLALWGDTLSLALPRPRDNPRDQYSYAVLEGPAGLTVDRATGLLSWRPTLMQVDQPTRVRVLALETSPDHPRPTYYSFTLTARARNVVRRIDLDFSSVATDGLRDRQGQPTGFTTRLPGTGALLPAFDPQLQLEPAQGALALTTTQSDFFGQAGLGVASVPGVALAALGFTGVEDFAAVAHFRPLHGLELIDQVGLYVGSDSATLTRAGTIVWAEPERYSTHTQGGADHSGRFFGFGLNVADGMTVALQRESGSWHYSIDDLGWNPLAPTTFLDGRSDLVAGVFGITPINNRSKVVHLEAFSLVVATQEPQLTALEAWRIRHFAQLEATGVAADAADPDDDGVSNQDEFVRGTDPLDAASR